VHIATFLFFNYIVYDQMSQVKLSEVIVIDRVNIAAFSIAILLLAHNIWRRRGRYLQVVLALRSTFTSKQKLRLTHFVASFTQPYLLNFDVLSNLIVYVSCVDDRFI